ncbi:MAG: hypothetical protein N2559_13960 [Anaerolineae bacterium]|nr:hypothetical protein [Anaerolineae bacterium]
MRTTFTFVLYLLVDTDEPARLRGILRPIANEADYPFSDEQELLDLMHQITSRVSMTLTAEQQEVTGYE